MVDDNPFDTIASSLAELIDPSIERYRFMYGAIVQHNINGSKGKIIERPNDSKYDGVYITTVFLRMEDDEVVHRSPGAFITEYSIIENKSFANLDISFGMGPSVDPLLDRMRAADILKGRK
jgi:hypothetical protein